MLTANNVNKRSDKQRGAGFSCLFHFLSDVSGVAIEICFKSIIKSVVMAYLSFVKELFGNI